ncbi:MAG: hypothetical protein C4318_04780 [Acidimicrobiia bacterium]
MSSQKGKGAGADQMSDDTSPSNDVGKDKRHLTLVLSESLEDDTRSRAARGSTHQHNNQQVTLALKTLYRQSDLLEVRIKAEQKRKAISEALALWGTAPKTRHRSRRLWLGVAILALFTAALIPAYEISRNSLPGDPLWKLKRADESVRQWLARGPEAEARVALANTRERLEEAKLLADDERFEAARNALALFYSEFDSARRRLRMITRESHPELYAEADRQLEEAAALDERLNGAAARTVAPRRPEAVGTLSPTPRPPWEPENPQEPPHSAG